MISVPSQQIPAVFNALSPFRLGNEMRLLQTPRLREDFIEDGWKRAAAAAGLDCRQRFSSSCLFIAQFAQDYQSVGFYLRHDPDHPAAQLYLARTNVPTASAMRLIRLNPELFADFPYTEPLLLSVVTYSEGPRFHPFARSEGLWWPSPRDSACLSAD